MFKKFTQSDLEPDRYSTETSGRIFCQRCDALLTHTRSATRIGGQHSHRRRNPAGVEFTFRCFSEAPGTRREGHHTHVYSWFPDSAWCYLVCRHCATHLGWHFQGKLDFCALISARLRDERPP